MAVLGSTRDDAVGECFDKVARVLGLPYPGGKYLDELSQTGRDDAYVLPHAHVADAPMDLSFSGLKTAVINLVHNAQQKGEALSLPDLAASFSGAVSGALIPRVLHAAARPAASASPWPEGSPPTPASARIWRPPVGKRVCGSFSPRWSSAGTTPP